MYDLTVSFPNNQLLSLLLGEKNKHLKIIEEKLAIAITSRGNTVFISGAKHKAILAKEIMQEIYHNLQDSIDIDENDIEATIRMKKTKNTTSPSAANAPIIATTHRTIVPYTPMQKIYSEALFEKNMIFATGPAGTGKTYLAIAAAVSMLLTHQIEKIILCRPAIEAGEKIGFLPGDIKEKIDPYMQPLYDALYDMLPGEKLAKHLDTRTIEVAPLAFMRGRTLTNAFIILDEAQNATITQMKMFLTRMGKESRMIINGDLTQIDLPPHIPSGLSDALIRLQHIKEIVQISFQEEDIVRNPLITKIIKAYHP